MRKRVLILAGAVALALILAVPASATPPVNVSVETDWCVPAGPPIGRDAGNNCMVEHFWTCGWKGDLNGEASILLHIQDFGSCSELGPYSHKANGHGKGTFEGQVCLGDECRVGKFDYNMAQQFTTTNVVGTLTILRGYDGLEGLHGTLIRDGSKDPAYDRYTGELHFDP